MSPMSVLTYSSQQNPDADLTFSVKARGDEAAMRDAVGLPYLRSDVEKQRALAGEMAAVSLADQDSDDPDADLDI